jgi:hypothetical protein
MKKIAKEGGEKMHIRKPHQNNKSNDGPNLIYTALARESRSEGKLFNFHCRRWNENTGISAPRGRSNMATSHKENYTPSSFLMLLGKELW